MTLLKPGTRPFRSAFGTVPGSTAEPAAPPCALIGYAATARRTWPKEPSFVLEKSRPAVRLYLRAASSVRPEPILIWPGGPWQRAQVRAIVVSLVLSP